MLNFELYVNGLFFIANSKYIRIKKFKPLVGVHNCIVIIICIK